MEYAERLKNYIRERDEFVTKFIKEKPNARAFELAKEVEKLAKKWDV